MYGLGARNGFSPLAGFSGIESSDVSVGARIAALPTEKVTTAFASWPDGRSGMSMSICFTPPGRVR